MTTMAMEMMRKMRPRRDTAVLDCKDAAYDVRVLIPPHQQNKCGPTAAPVRNPDRLSQMRSLVALAVSILLSGSVSAAVVPAPPTNVTATPVATTSVNIAWTASSGAASYQVRRKTGPTFTTIGTATATSFRDDGVFPGAAYAYVVR